MSFEKPRDQRFRTQRVDKPWGHETLWALTDRYVGKVLFVRAGESLSLQYHREKDETLSVLSGRILLEWGSSEDALTKEDLGPGECLHVTPGTRHRLTAVEDAHVLEASTTELDDVVRLSDRYGREGTSAP